MAQIDLRGKPFGLDEEGVQWVYDTWRGMSLEQKCGQVFCPMGFDNQPQTLKHLTQEIGVGGMMYRADHAENIWHTHHMLQELSPVPLLLAANTEAGGDGLASEGTSFGKSMAVAATNDPENGYRMGLTACREGAALGLNWAFAPIVDINYDFHNPITNVRTFGDNPQKILDFARGYLRAADACGVAAALKHFPGDGVDERDQHIVTSVNAFSVEQWDQTYGFVYKNLIDLGAKTVMVGHIAQPAYVRALNPKAGRTEQLCPASLSPELLEGLLRKRLGFQGLISTDATPMVGFTSAMQRRQAIPKAIAAGCDMILFNKSLDEDYAYLIQGVREGLLSEQRLDEAVLRILGIKASLRLHEKKEEDALVPDRQALAQVGCKEHRAWAKGVADQSITLVRDEQQLLPLSPEKYPRVYLNVIQKDTDVSHPFVQKWKKMFEQEGFAVTVRDRGVSISVEDFADPSALSEEKKLLMHEMYRSVEEMKRGYDLYVYICNMENASNNTTLRLNWNVCFGLGDDAPWFVSEIPAMMISTAYPFHLFDAPMIRTYINCYSGNDDFINAAMDKIMGRSAFTGVSPVDVLCGKTYI